jgi:pimeloyl-ACP methyl ester carboxylesterase
MSNQLESEKLSYEYIVEQYEKEGNKSVLYKLEKSPIDEKTNLPTEYWSMRDDMMHSLGVGTTRNMKSVITGIFLPVMKSSEYTLKEKINLWRYKFTSPSIQNLQNEEYKTDLNKKVPKVEVPVYFCHGRYDYTISYDLTKEYFNKLQSPIKGFYTFNESAHSPMFEEPEKFSSILEEDVFKGTNGLAD